MNELLELLKSGDLRSDGCADEVAYDVIHNPELFKLLLDGLDEDDDVVRARTSHALEKVSRSCPEFFSQIINMLITYSLDDDLPVVKWHLAMLFANLKFTSEEAEDVLSTLYLLLDDDSVFVKSWTISSLTIVALDHPDNRSIIKSKLKALETSKSAAVRNRVSKAMKVLDDGEMLPKGWCKRKQ
jgi:hypothetical protein